MCRLRRLRSRRVARAALLLLGWLHQRAPWHSVLAAARGPMAMARQGRSAMEVEAEVATEQHVYACLALAMTAK